MPVRHTHLLAPFLLCARLLSAQPDTIPFDDARWVLGNARIVEHLGRKALVGSAQLRNVEFGSGVIEYDLAVTGARSYPGVVFRSHPDGSWERFYIRPHRTGRVAPSLYQDVLQYVPSWNRVDSWQLYSGRGYTAGSVIPTDRWFHVRLEVSGDRARVYVDNRAKPDLEVPHLRHGVRTGGIALMAPGDGSAYYSNFSIRKDDALSLGPVRREDVAPGFIRAWHVSQPVRVLSVDEQGTTLPPIYATLRWQALEADAGGLVDVARVHPRTGQPDLVYLKTTLRADRAGPRTYRLGYSDQATIYLNGTKVFAGSSAYQGRDPSFLGIIGLNDWLTLPLKAGDNELVVGLSEVSGGWGFQLQAADAIGRAAGIAEAWRTDKSFDVPESAAYDAKRQRLYVSNWQPYASPGSQDVTQLGVGGGSPTVLVTGLRNPTGLAVHGDKLYAVEARSVAEIDIEKRVVVRRFDIPGASTLNDVAVDASGTLYVSDPPAGVIYRIVNGTPEAWLKGPDVVRPNGVCVSGDQLVWANNGDGYLKAADLKSGSLRVIADLNGGIMDGVANGPNGSWLVSHNEGRIFQISATGSVTPLLDLTVPGINIADFAFLPEKRMVVFPTFADNRVMAFTLPAGNK